MRVKLQRTKKVFKIDQNTPPRVGEQGRCHVISRCCWDRACGGLGGGSAASLGSGIINHRNQARSDRAAGFVQAATH